MSGHGHESHGGGHESHGGGGGGGGKGYFKRFLKEFSPLFLAGTMLFNMFDQKGVTDFINHFSNPAVEFFSAPFTKGAGGGGRPLAGFWWLLMSA